MGETYRLHRLIISRSSYFRNMLHGPWKEAGAPTVVLHIDDLNVNSEAITVALAYLYGQPPKLNDSNAFRVLAAASFLDLQDLCAMCTDFIISELCTSNFLQYQVFAEGQDYGIHGERVKIACWGFLCQSATMELREVLPKLSSQTLHALLTSDELWVPNEKKRFELALYTLLAKSAVCEVEVAEDESMSSKAGSPKYESSTPNGNVMASESCKEQLMELDSQGMQLQESVGLNAAENNFSISECVMNLQVNAPYYVPAQKFDAEPAKGIKNKLPLMEPAAENMTYQLTDNVWLSQDRPGDYYVGASSNLMTSHEWGRANTTVWGGRVVGRREVKSIRGSSSLPAEEYDTFVNIYEKGSLLYCNMSFEALLSVRKRLEELGFPCKAVNDGLWLQMLLCHRVQAIGADTCRNCCLTSTACTCRQLHGYARGGPAVGHFNRNSAPPNIGNIFVEGQSDANSLFGPIRGHARVAADGLAGIGRGTSNVSGATWPPTRYVFSRVSLAIDESEPRVDYNGDVAGDGLTALVGLSTESSYEYNTHGTLAGAASTSVAADPSGQIESNDVGPGWVASENSSISLDVKTPLSHFPPFRFGVEFEDVHRLTDGQVKHSSEAFYAGSLWKVSVQAFNDEDPHGRRTLGLFLHRRKAEPLDHLRKGHMYIDCRDKVTARYQLICPSKREIMVFGSLKQAGTLLPKAPKGWGWRTAILFDELPDLLQGGALRVSAVVQLV